MKFLERISEFKLSNWNFNFKNSSRKTFKRFPDLPFELRVLIWSYSIFLPRILPIGPSTACNCPPFQDHIDNPKIFQHLTDCYITRPHYQDPENAYRSPRMPIALTICRETRKLGLERYEWFVRPLGSWPLCIDLERDILWFGPAYFITGSNVEKENKLGVYLTGSSNFLGLENEESCGKIRKVGRWGYVIGEEERSSRLPEDECIRGLLRRSLHDRVIYNAWD
ncbi:hypothetical protein BGZ60DRAFT_421410 [Tricladium varicosporioides]|nr:hypothetical protein BGZ60DRAFT_421410 [Hymenoscyphus varicosporioides]